MVLKKTIALTCHDLPVHAARVIIHKHNVRRRRVHLGIKGIRLGPSLPAFITPNVLDVLVKNFDIKPISTPDEDLKAILG